MFPYGDSKTVSVCLSVPQEKKSPWLRQYQSYISNWYINGKVFSSTAAWKPKNLIFFSRKFSTVESITVDAKIILVGFLHLFENLVNTEPLVREICSFCCIFSRCINETYKALPCRFVVVICKIIWKKGLLQFQSRGSQSREQLHQIFSYVYDHLRRNVYHYYLKFI